MKHLTGREQNIFVVAVLSLSIFSGYRLVIIPLRQKVESIDRQMVEDMRQIRKTQASLDDYQGMDQKYEALTKDFRQDGSNEQVMARISREIEKVSGEFELQISELKPQRVRSNEYYNSFSVSLRLSSPLPEIVKFLDRLQASPYGYAVQDLRLDKSNRRGSKDITTTVILEKVFVPPVE